jgi:hypothetical protein
MPPDSAAERVAERLAQGSSSTPELMRALSLSQATVSRALRDLERHQRVLRMGSTRGVRYGLRRPVAAVGSQWPIYRIDEEGTPHELGTLDAIQRESYYVTAGPERIRGFFEGIPYYLQDARPAGFLGRAVPNAYPELDLPARVTDWTDEHFLTYLTQRASDTSGDLVVGAESLNRYLAATDARIVSADNRAQRYPQLANAAMGGAPPGSSAHGEHPKFTACVAHGKRRTHVIVKFSPPRSTPAGQRWADLLTAEYTAHRVLEAHGVSACRSDIFDFGERLFLECERFDRIGADGRRGAVSLHSVDLAFYGRIDNWTASAERLATGSLLPSKQADRIRFLDAFGALIANTDRHFGNITLFDAYEGAFELAPVYDMLPMLFAPQDGHLLPRKFEPTPARAEWLSVWAEARTLADTYWTQLAQDARITPQFRHICAESLRALRAMSGRSKAVRAPKLVR